MRVRIPSSLNSGAWETGPNLPHGLIRQRDARGSPFSLLLSKRVYLLSNPQRTRDGRYRPPPAQNRASGIPARGSHLGCVTAKRICGHG